MPRMAVAKNNPVPDAKVFVTFSIYLIFISALVRLGSSLYLPALPRMGLELGLSASQLSWTLTVYMAVFAVASVLMGPLSDCWGRRIMIQGGLAAYFGGSLLCAVVHGYAGLLLGRVLQALGGSAILVSTRAMAREAFNDRQMIKVLGWISAVSGLVPMLAPVLGGLLTQGLGWRANFYLLTATALAVGVFARRQAHETLAVEHRMPLNFLKTLRAYAGLLITWDYMLPLIPAMLCFAVQGAYLVGAPFIFIHVLHLTPAAFGATGLVLVGALIAGRSLCLFLLARVGPFATFVAGSALALLSGTLFLCILWAGWVSVATLLAASACFCLGFGALLPLGMKTALSAAPARVGVASALYGCLTLGATAAGSALLGGLLDRSGNDIYRLGVITFAAGLCMLAVSLCCRRAMANTR